MPAKLGYWNVRGLGGMLRLALAYYEEEYEETHYELGDAPDFSRQGWLDKKFTLGYDFPNLPYFQDGDLKLTQTDAILRYIAEKNDFGGADAKSRAHLGMLNSSVQDLRMALIRICYNPEFEKLKAGFLTELPAKLAQLEIFLEGKQWFSGAKIDYPDFNLCDLLDILKRLEPTCLERCPNLEAYLERFEELPVIKAYLASDKCILTPINNKIAAWGNTKE